MAYNYLLNSYYRGQEKHAQIEIDLVKKYFKGFELLKTEISGRDLDPEFEKIRNKAKEGSERKQNRAEKKIERLKKLSEDVLISFYFGSPLIKLVYTRTGITRISLSKVRWTALLDFPISDPFMFGRVAKKVGKYGNYLFAPLEQELPIIYSLINIIKEKFPNINPEKLVEFPPLIDFLSSEHLVFTGNMHKTYQIIKNGQSTGNNFIDFLNSNGSFKKVLKKNPHLGNFSMRDGNKIITFPSTCDISVMCFPYGNHTILQIIELAGYRKHSFKALGFLIDHILRP